MQYQINESVAASWADGHGNIKINEKLILNAHVTSWQITKKDGDIRAYHGPLYSTPDKSPNPYYKMWKDAFTKTP